MSDDSEKAWAGERFIVSGKKRIINRMAQRPSAAIPRKAARQPNATCRTPPSEGATIGASAVIEPMRASSRPARAPW